MFIKQLRMEMKRACVSRKMFISILVIGVLLFASVWEEVGAVIQSGAKEDYQLVGAADMLQQQMQFDYFKIVMVIVLSGIYAGSFCKDDKNHYVRLILNRSSVRQYTIARFLANTISVVLAAILSCFLTAFVLVGMGFPFVQTGKIRVVTCYKEILKDAPLLYIAMMGLQFGMVVAMFSSIGLMYSAWQTDTFICIGVSSFLFYVVISSQVLLGSPFDILNLVGMRSTLPQGDDAAQGLMFAWGMIFPSVVIVGCWVMFHRRMKWRMDNGYI